MGAVLAAASFVAVAGMSLRVASVPPVLDLDHIQHNGGIADIRQMSVTNAAKIKRTMIFCAGSFSCDGPACCRRCKRAGRILRDRSYSVQKQKWTYRDMPSLANN
jgi:hypothetical protein